MKRSILIFPALALLSCSELGFFQEKEQGTTDDYSRIRISTDNLLLFADLDGKNVPGTKSSDAASETVSLESLLDRKAAEQITFKSRIVRQIPFIDNKDNKRVMFTRNLHESVNADSLTVIRTFLIETTDTLSGHVMRNVATMIPDVEYIEMFGAESVSFLEKSTYTGIILYSSLDGTLETIYTGGRVSGNGSYSKGQLVICHAINNKGFYFDRWVGDLKGFTELCSFQIEDDIESTAYFGSMLEPEKKPCWDKVRNLSNPLANMELAPTGWGMKNFIGSTFGWTRIDRYGEKVYHSGIDLFAEPGTPLYAICDGEISHSRYVTGQPNRDKNDNYPPGYSGDTDGAGNRFTLVGNIDGETVNFSYWHLNEGTPIAINPRTGKPFNKGDKVYRGELIAYSGRTGNANDVDYPHLHFVARNDKDQYIDPEDYLNGHVSDTLANGSRRIYETEIVGIKCDEEEKIYSYIEAPIEDNDNNSNTKITL